MARAPELTGVSDLAARRRSFPLARATPMNAYTALAYQFLAGAAVLGFFTWQLLAHGFDALLGFRSVMVGAVAVLCGLGVIASVIATLDRGRLAAADAVAFLLGAAGLAAASLLG